MEKYFPVVILINKIFPAKTFFSRIQELRMNKHCDGKSLSSFVLCIWAYLV